MATRAMSLTTARTVSRKAGKRTRAVRKAWKPYFKNWWGLPYIAIAIVVAQVVLLANPTAGAYVNALAFAALVGLALWQEKFRQVAISAEIIPVATMIALSLPQSSTFAQTMVFYDAILLLALIYRYVFTLDEPLDHTRLRARGYGTVLPLMVVVGQALGLIGYGLLRNHYTFDSTSLPLVAVSAVVFAVAEETLFRGLIQQRGAHVMHPVMAAVLTAILYTATGIDHITYLAPLFGLLEGSILSYIYFKKQNLLLTCTANATSKLVYIGLMAAFIFR